MPIVPVNPDGTPNFEGGILGAALNTGAGAASAKATPVPVDSSGMVDTWSLPSYLQGNEKKIWFDTGHEKLSMGEHAGPGPDSSTAKFRLDHPGSFDINASAIEIMKQFAAMSVSDPTTFRELQVGLQAAGFMGNDKTVVAGWSTQTENAIANAMVKYLQVSQGAGVAVSFKDWLGQTAQQNAAYNPQLGQSGGAGGGTLPSRPTLADPDQLRLYAQKAAQAVLGRDLPEGELQKFVDQFHTEQTQSYNNALSGQGTVTDKSDPSASALAFVEGNNKPEYGQHQVQGYTDAFLNMFLGGASAAPNVNVDPSAAGV